MERVWHGESVRHVDRFSDWEIMIRFDRQFWNSQFQQLRNTYEVYIADAGYSFPHARNIYHYVSFFIFLFQEPRSFAARQCRGDTSTILSLILLIALYYSMLLSFFFSDIGACKHLCLMICNKICKSIFAILSYIFNMSTI